MAHASTHVSAQSLVLSNTPGTRSYTSSNDSVSSGSSQSGERRRGREQHRQIQSVLDELQRSMQPAVDASHHGQQPHPQQAIASSQQPEPTGVVRAAAPERPSHTNSFIDTSTGKIDMAALRKKYLKPSSDPPAPAAASLSASARASAATVLATASATPSHASNLPSSVSRSQLVALRHLVCAEGGGRAGSGSKAGSAGPAREGSASALAKGIHLLHDMQRKDRPRSRSRGGGRGDSYDSADDTESLSDRESTSTSETLSSSSSEAGGGGARRERLRPTRHPGGRRRRQRRESKRRRAEAEAQYDKVLGGMAYENVMLSQGYAPSFGKAGAAPGGQHMAFVRQEVAQQYTSLQDRHRDIVEEFRGVLRTEQDAQTQLRRQQMDEYAQQIARLNTSAKAASDEAAAGHLAQVQRMNDELREQRSRSEAQIKALQAEAAEARRALDSSLHQQQPERQPPPPVAQGGVVRSGPSRPASQTLPPQFDAHAIRAASQPTSHKRPGVLKKLFGCAAAQPEEPRPVAAEGHQQQAGPPVSRAPVRVNRAAKGAAPAPTPAQQQQIPSQPQPLPQPQATASARHATVAESPSDESSSDVELEQLPHQQSARAVVLEDTDTDSTGTGERSRRKSLAAKPRPAEQAAAAAPAAVEPRRARVSTAEEDSSDDDTDEQSGAAAKPAAAKKLGIFGWRDKRKAKKEKKAKKGPPAVEAHTQEGKYTVRLTEESCLGCVSKMTQFLSSRIGHEETWCYSFLGMKRQ